MPYIFLEWQTFMPRHIALLNQQTFPRTARWAKCDSDMTNTRARPAHTSEGRKWPKEEGTSIYIYLHAPATAGRKAARESRTSTAAPARDARARTNRKDPGVGRNYIYIAIRLRVEKARNLFNLKNTYFTRSTWLRKVSRPAARMATYSRARRLCGIFAVDSINCMEKYFTREDEVLSRKLGYALCIFSSEFSGLSLRAVKRFIFRDTRNTCPGRVSFPC